jgi:hypothetical protein
MAAAACLAAAKATGTVWGYSFTLHRYNAFCTLAGLEPLSFSEDVLVQFVLHLHQREAGHHLLASVKPALVYLSSTMGVSRGFTPAVDLLFAGAKRRARATAGPARKAPALSLEDLAAVLSRVFPPHDRVGLVEAAHMRTAFCLVVEYHTLCRLACFRQLRACHFELAGDNIIITFPTAKNDQLHMGRSSCLGVKVGLLPGAHHQAVFPTPRPPLRPCRGRQALCQFPHPAGSFSRSTNSGQIAERVPGDR